MTLLVGSIFHVTRKIVSEMTYNVSMGTLNPTIPYHTGVEYIAVYAHLVLKCSVSDSQEFMFIFMHNVFFTFNF